ncbi:MAG TPA: isochorismatase family protein [Actinomycetota bacterium]|nr:isochorismatase family protein [Actinomycetota bacterium]
MAVPSYDPLTAVVVVDVQNDFAHPDGGLYVTGGEDVVPIINEAIGGAKEAGATVVYTADWHPESTPHFAKDGGIWPVHCVMDTWGAEFHGELVVDGPIVRKGSNGEDGYSGFSMRDHDTGETVPTELGGLLRERGIRHLVVCGLATDYCVNATALDGMREGFKVRVLWNAIRAVNLKEGDGDRAIAEVERAGGEILRRP